MAFTPLLTATFLHLAGCDSTPNEEGATPADATQAATTEASQTTADAIKAICEDCNVLWMVIDTTRADYVGCFGGDKRNAPTVDQLCADGTSFQHPYSQAPYTLLSVSSYFTGRYRRNTGINFNMWQGEDFHPLSEDVTTVAEVLSENGYRSRGITANKMIGPRESDEEGRDFSLNFNQGFETWEKLYDNWMAKAAPELLSEVKDDKFFLYLHIMGPHDPNPRIEGFNERRGTNFPESLGEVSNSSLRYAQLTRNEIEYTDQHVELIKELYADALWEADTTIVKPMLDKLAELELDKKTLVIVSSDHGEMLGELYEPVVRSKGGPSHQAYWGHSHPTLVEEVLHVPLVFRGPGIDAGVAVTDQMAQIVDIGPTITAYLGIEQEDDWGWDGNPLFGPNAVKKTTSIADSGSGKSSRSNARNFDHSVTWLDRSVKKFLYYELKKSVEPREPREKVSRLDAHAPLEVELNNYMENLHPPSAVDSIAGPSGEDLAELQALGYMDAPEEVE